MSKKAQIAGQMFIYIMAVIIVGAIALIGYNAIKESSSKACQVEQLSFRAELDELISKYNAYGSVNKEILPAPCSYEMVCFVDAGATSVKCENSIVKDSIDGKQNIFVVSSSLTFPLGYSHLIKTEKPDECLCIKTVNNNFHITFIGRGSATEIRSSD